jgi:hypothetical protein
VRDLGVYVKGQNESFFMDFLAMKRHDHNFTSSAWSEATTILANRGMGLGKEIKCLKVWSDGGLKTKENLFFFPPARHGQGDHHHGEFFRPLSRSF